MQVHVGWATGLPAFSKAVVTIGTFDGVHIGHRHIIDQLKQRAAAVKGETVIITFDPHPRSVISPEKAQISLLNTLPERIRLLNEAGVDHLVVVPFDQAFAAMSAEGYVKDFLVRYFNPHTVVIGYDHHFGKGRAGNYTLLHQYGIELGFAVEQIPEQVIRETVISSTRIREALQQNDITTANALLGYAYFLEGEVVKGNQLGRTIGYPTANIKVEDEHKLTPGNGVYAVTAVLTDEPDTRYKGMMNIGVRPTVDGTRSVTEVNLFDFDRDIYGKTLRVQLHHHLRQEVRFAGLDALKAQLGADKEQAMQLLTV
jgi:riboflavin kinase/FMN adenylyltransferase